MDVSPPRTQRAPRYAEASALPASQRFVGVLSMFHRGGRWRLMDGSPPRTPRAPRYAENLCVLCLLSALPEPYRCFTAADAAGLWMFHRRGRWRLMDVSPPRTPRAPRYPENLCVLCVSAVKKAHACTRVT